MGRRKCIFTGLPANSKHKVIPKSCSEDVLHNWANNVPCSTEYELVKKDRMPDDLEIEAMEFFQQLELAKLRVEYYKDKLQKIQDILKTRLREKPDMSSKKRKEIETAIKVKDVLEELDEHVESTLESEAKKGMW